MAYPAGTPTRTVSLGGAVSIEDGADLIIKVVISSSRSLVRDSTGYRFERSSKTVQSLPGLAVEFSLPVTDAAGWRDAVTGAMIDVAAVGSYTHRYSAVVELLDGARTVGTGFTVGPFTVPSGGTVLDLDKFFPVNSVQGGTVLIPDTWTAILQEAQRLSQVAIDLAGNDLALGTTSTTAAAGNDARLSDARTPLPHTSALVTDFNEAAQDAVALLLAGASGITLAYDDVANSLTITGGGAAGLDSEAVRDAIGVALVGVGLITVLVNDAADTITFSTTATANATDAALRDRAFHTGSSPTSSITGFTEAVQDIVGLYMSGVAGTGATVVYNDTGNVLTVSGPLVSGLLPLAALSASALVVVRGTVRSSSRTDQPHLFINPTAVPIVVPPSLAGMYDGVDIQIKTA